jgi:hypothetical protein
VTYDPLTSTGVRRRRSQCLLGWLLTSGSRLRTELADCLTAWLDRGPPRGLVHVWSAGFRQGSACTFRGQGAFAVSVCLVVAVGFR